ncbi:MAG: hypothetical protein IT168_03570 [Bryobacterales bacterium]|nr:hypothetical protein [Bryobacterales bacterium]
MTPDHMNPPQPRHHGYHARIRTSIIRLAGWTLAWLAATALMKFGPIVFWNKAVAFTLLAVGLDLAVGVGMILATKKYVTELDDLQQKIYLDALGITVGVGLIAGIPYSVMDSYHVMPFKADVAHIVILMAVTFSASCVYGSWRYR